MAKHASVEYRFSSITVFTTSLEFGIVLPVLPVPVSSTYYLLLYVYIQSYFSRETRC